MKFYAEYETDKIIRENYFPNLDYKGIVVEVGGATPEFLSMSKHFKDNGWRAIVIEPNPNFVEMQRSFGNEVYEYACSYEDKDNQDFTIVEQNVHAYGGLVTDHSFSSLKVKDEYLRHTGFVLNQNNSRNIKVNVRKLETILEELSINRIDILSIDVEGWELEVMMGIDTSKFLCHYIILENFVHNPSYDEYMRNIGYNLVRKIEYNYIYESSNW